MKLELLSPAKTAEIGIAAINHGADAVYIGGPHFGARAAAANSIDDIAKLVRYAHLFYSRVYLTLNTLFAGEGELESAAETARQAYGIGVDALIIQDIRLLEYDLPSIPLHASTQMDNRTPQKAAMLEELGFQQIVLARELNLEQIAAIRQATTLPLEFFVHGALCVSYSGRCFMSERAAGRSANRGECAQCCRHHYSLQTQNGEKLADGYLLSLKDLNLSGSLRELLSAGISSFKIEGRLKESGYVKNITAYYRQKLDAILEEKEHLPSSSGKAVFDFFPNPSKSFHRSQTDYYLHKKRNKTAEIRTPKATGERVGTAVEIRGSRFRLQSKSAAVPLLSGGDGLCYFDHQGKLCGIRVNAVEDGWICLREKVPFLAGTEIRRNHDSRFQKELAASNQPRKIAVKMELIEEQDGITLVIIDEDGVRSTTHKKCRIAPVKQGKTEKEIIEKSKKQLSRLGGTIFIMEKQEDILCTLLGKPFLPASLINELRRQAVDNHSEQRLHSFLRESAPKRKRPAHRTVEKLTVHSSDYPLMQTKYCIRYQLGLCTRGRKGKGKSVPKSAESLLLADKVNRYQVNFDCENCEMTIEKLR